MAITEIGEIKMEIFEVINDYLDEHKTISSLELKTELKKRGISIIQSVASEELNDFSQIYGLDFVYKKSDSGDTYKEYFRTDVEPEDVIYSQTDDGDLKN